MPDFGVHVERLRLWGKQQYGMSILTHLFQTVSLHSGLSQKEREVSLNKFRSAHSKILVSTDVASRGLDIPNVDVVINHNVPEQPKTYVHR